MTNEEIIRLLFSLLGGGIAVAILNWIRLNRTELRERKINFLDLQLNKLYGPLYYFVCQCEKLFELNRKWAEAYDKEYSGTKWSQDSNAQKAISKEASEIIKLRNTYIAEVEKNSEQIKEILNNHYAYIDREDIDAFTLFYEHYIRRKIELDNEKKWERSLRAYQYVGDISFLRPEFISRVKEKFIKKKEELDKLSVGKMNLTIKKIIAKEGLMLISIIFLGGMLILCAGFLKDITAPPIVSDQEMENPNAKCWHWMKVFYLIETNGIIIIFLGYFLVRFIIWAVKTLKQT